MSGDLTAASWYLCWRGPPQHLHILIGPPLRTLFPTPSGSGTCTTYLYDLLIKLTKTPTTYPSRSSKYDYHSERWEMAEAEYASCNVLTVYLCSVGYNFVRLYRSIWCGDDTVGLFESLPSYHQTKLKTTQIFSPCYLRHNRDSHIHRFFPYP